MTPRKRATRALMECARHLSIARSIAEPGMVCADLAWRHLELAAAAWAERIDLAGRRAA